MKQMDWWIRESKKKRMPLLYSKEKNNLRKKLVAWREDKAKKFAQQMEDLRRDEEKALENERLLKEKLAREKVVKKQMIQNFKQSKQELEQQQLMEEAQKMRELELIKMEQAKVNKERVEYRTQEIEQKKHEEMLRKAEQDKLEELKEFQLEKLREKVRVHVEGDTGRVLQGTFSSTKQVRNLPPLFHANHGYTDDVILGDTRFKIERALEKAGLLQTKYAAEVLASVPTKVRIDQLSSEQKEKYLKKAP